MITKTANNNTLGGFTLIFLQGVKSLKTPGLLSKNIELCCNISYKNG